MTDKPTNVRIAIPNDEEDLFEILMLAHQENAAMPVSKFRVKEIISNATQRKGGVIGVIDGKGRIEGCLSLTLARMPYTEEWHLEDVCNYVRPDCRKTKHAKDLIQFGKWIAEQMGFPLFIGILTAKRLEAKRRFYQRLVKEVGTIYVHNPIYGALAEAN